MSRQERRGVFEKRYGSKAFGFYFRFLVPIYERWVKIWINDQYLCIRIDSQYPWVSGEEYQIQKVSFRIAGHTGGKYV